MHFWYYRGNSEGDPAGVSHGEQWARARAGNGRGSVSLVGSPEPSRLHLHFSPKHRTWRLRPLSALAADTRRSPCIDGRRLPDTPLRTRHHSPSAVAHRFCQLGPFPLSRARGTPNDHVLRPTLPSLNRYGPPAADDTIIHPSETDVLLLKIADRSNGRLQPRAIADGRGPQRCRRPLL